MGFRRWLLFSAARAVGKENHSPPIVGPQEVLGVVREDGRKRAEWETRESCSPNLVRAAREQCNHHHEIGQREQQLIRLRASRFRGARNESQVTALGEITQVVDANPRQAGHFRIRKDFLARLDCNQG